MFLCYCIQNKTKIRHNNKTYKTSFVDLFLPEIGQLHQYNHTKLKINTVKCRLSERRLSETTGLFEDDGQSVLFLYYLLQ